MDWQMLTAIGTGVTAFILFVASIFGWSRLQAMRRARNAQLAVQLYQQFRTDEAKQDFYKIYQLTPEILEEWKRRHQLQEIEHALDNLEMLGILISEGIFDEALAIKIFGPWPIRCYSRLSGYIEERQKERGQYAGHVEDFTKRSMKYQIVHYPKSEWVKLQLEGRATEYLVEELKDKLLSKGELRIAKFKRTVRSVWNRSLREKI